MRFVCAIICGSVALVACSQSDSAVAPPHDTTAAATIAATSAAAQAAARGRVAIGERGCGACHRIDGVPNAVGRVGPPLSGIASREIIAGTLTNTPDNMRHFIQHPPNVNPHTAMPDIGLDSATAADMAAYLGTLK